MSGSDDPNEPRVILSEEFDPDGPEPLATRITRLVAVAENRESIQLTPIGSVVDTEALEWLFASRSVESPEVSIEVTFRYEGYLIEIDSDGNVRILVKTD